jgi:hypothetical protein
VVALRLASAALLLVALSALLFVALAPPPAGADGDPASDVLLGENVFYPYTPPVTGALQKVLNAETQAAKRIGFPLKVALIGSAVDLGVVPDLFGHPQKYADFLDQEISFQRKQPLLVVMAAGYGAQGLGAQARTALASLPGPAGTRSDDLARAAILAVSRVARAEDHPIRDVAGAPGAATSSGSGSTLTLIVLATAAVLIAAALATVTVQRRRDRARS